jgi:hypothetical protein
MLLRVAPILLTEKCLTGFTCAGQWNNEGLSSVNRRIQKLLISAVVGLLVVVLAVSVTLTLINNRNHRNLLDESVKSNLISISIAARELIDIEKFYSYNSIEDIKRQGSIRPYPRGAPQIENPPRRNVYICAETYRRRVLFCI